MLTRKHVCIQVGIKLTVIVICSGLKGKHTSGAADAFLFMFGLVQFSNHTAFTEIIVSSILEYYIFVALFYVLLKCSQFY